MARRKEGKAKMTPYANKGGESGLLAFEIGIDYILVEFNSGRYTYASAGRDAVETMKELVSAGEGLNSFISSKATQPEYSEKY